MRPPVYGGVTLVRTGLKYKIGAGITFKLLHLAFLAESVEVLYFRIGLEVWERLHIVEIIFG